MDGPQTIGDTPPPCGIPVARPVVVLPRDHAVPSHPMLLRDATRREALFDVGRLFLVVLFTWLFAMTLATVLEWSGFDGDLRVLNISLSLGGGAVIVIGTIVIAQRHRQWAASVGLCSDRWWATILCGVVAIAAAYVSMLATVGVTALVYPAGLEAMERNKETIAESFPKLHPLLLCAVALFVGFYEELICRGFLLTRLRRATGSATLAVLVSSLIFAAPHAASQEAITVVPLFAMAVTWAVITLWRKSVIPAILAHAVFDLINLLFIFYAPDEWMGRS